MAKSITLKDTSGNVITHPLVDGNNPIQVVLTGTTMALYVDDVLIAETPYTPIAAGVITCNATTYALREAI